MPVQTRVRKLAIKDVLERVKDCVQLPVVAVVMVRAYRLVLEHAPTHAMVPVRILMRRPFQIR